MRDSVQGAIKTPLSKRPQFRKESDWQAYGERLTAFGRYLLRHGVRLAYHHHMGAYCETPAEVDTLMRITGEEVGLLFDTGHMAFGGAQPQGVPAVLEKHVKRVCHVHCKDVRPQVIERARASDWSFLESVLNGAFTVPGDGAIDYQRGARHSGPRRLQRLAGGRSGSRTPPKHQATLTRRRAIAHCGGWWTRSIAPENQNRRRPDDRNGSVRRGPHR